MAMFTGLTNTFLKEGDALTTLKPTVYQELPTTVRLLSKAGYATVSLHGHTSELYNRATNYPAIGFDTVDFSEDFITPVETAGQVPLRRHLCSGDHRPVREPEPRQAPLPLRHDHGEPPDLLPGKIQHPLGLPRPKQPAL